MGRKLIGLSSRSKVAVQMDQQDMNFLVKVSIIWDDLEKNGICVPCVSERLNRPIVRLYIYKKRTDQLSMILWVFLTIWTAWSNPICQRRQSRTITVHAQIINSASDRWRFREGVPQLRQSLVSRLEAYVSRSFVQKDTCKPGTRSWQLTTDIDPKHCTYGHCFVPLWYLPPGIKE